MQEKRIYLATPTMHGEEQEFIKEAFDTNWIAPLGKNVDEFEKSVANYIGVSAATALSSGTAALHLALKLCDVKEDDIILCSDLTFSATVNPVSYEKAKQVYIDSEEESWNIDPEALKKAIQKYPQAKAVIVVHLYGTPAKMEEIEEICDEYNIPIIEDAAESLGAMYNDKQTGAFGKYAAISFNGNKIITTSGGGMLVSNDEEAIKKAHFWATQSREAVLHYEHKEIGYNYRMSNIVAGIGRGQMLHLDEHIALKKRIYEVYKEAFRGLPVTMNPYLKNTQPNFWLSCILIDENCNVNPNTIIEKLAEDNIEARPIWKPMHMQPVFSDCDFISANEEALSKKIFEKGLCLPSDIKMTSEEQQRVIDIVKSCF